MKIPFSLIVDDPAPIISVYYEHGGGAPDRLFSVPLAA